MKTMHYSLLFALIYLCFGCLFWSCTTNQRSQQEIRFMHDSPENYQGATTRNLEMGEEPWKIKQIFQLSAGRIFIAKVFDFNHSNYLILGLGNWEQEVYLFGGPLEKVKEQTTHIADIKLGFNFLDNFRSLNGQVYFYEPEGSDYCFSLDSFKVKKIEEYPFEKVNDVNAVISPDGKLKVSWSDNTIYLKNLETSQNEILWDDPEFNGNWSIGDIVWSHDSKRLYFDNSGPVACIWELDLENNTLKKIVSDHEAIHPCYFSRNGYDYLLYVQYDIVRIATNDPNADGYLRQEFLISDQLRIPLKEIHATSPGNLEMMPFRSIEKTASENTDMDEVSYHGSLWKVGTIMDNPYRGGIMYREEFMSSDKGGESYYVTRYIKLKDQLIVLPLSSSIKYNSFTVGNSYLRSTNLPLTFSLLFTDCDTVVFDYSVAVKGIYIPDTLAHIPGYYRIAFTEEKLIDRSSEPANYRISKPENLMKQLSPAYEDNNVGVIYMENEHYTEGMHPALQHRSGGLFILTSDESLLVYRLIPEFTGSIPLDQEIDLNDYSFVSDWGYFGEGGGPLDKTLFYTHDQLFKSELQVLGLNNHGDTLWGTMETEHPLVTKEYDRIRENRETFEQVNKYIPQTYRDFLQSVPVFFWKDPFGRYIRFIKSDYMMPLLAEPIIYLYDDGNRIFNINLDKRIRVASSIPTLNSGWKVYGTKDGKVIQHESGEKYDHLFWEGFAGLIPINQVGYTVKRDELQEFFDTKLSQMGLIQHEIDDFKAAWLPEMCEAPSYFVSFYNQDLIDQIAPLELDPRPETVIRILMDYKPVYSLQAKTHEPEPVKTPERKGTTLVEWGGLRRH